VSTQAFKAVVFNPDSVELRSYANLIPNKKKADSIFGASFAWHLITAPWFTS